MSKNTNLSFLTDYITADITNGRIGINNASPTVAFDVTGVAKFSSSVTANGGLRTTSANGYQDTDGTRTIGVYSNFSNSTAGIGTISNNDLGFFTNATEKMRITSAGNVGIGTTSPITKFHIAGTNVVQYIESTTTTNYAELQILNTTNYLQVGIEGVTPNTRMGGTIAYNAYLGTYNNYGMTFHTNNLNRLTITSAGNVGIGTTSPSSYGNLTVVMPSASNGTGIVIKAINDGGGSSQPALTFLNGSSATIAQIIADNGTGYLAFNTGSTSTERMKITTGGDFLWKKSSSAVAGIGFLMQSANADIYSSIANGTNTYHVYDTTNSAYRFYVTSGGTINASNPVISAISDQRLKENITDLEFGLDSIMALRPRKFDWKEKSGNTGKNLRGFIAQEFEQVFPDLIDKSINVAPEGEEAYKQIRVDLMPVLVKAIQELKAEINLLKNK